MKRFWIYQKERFPLAAHGPLIAAFSASAVSFSALLRGTVHAPAWSSYVAAFVVSLGSFALLRIADEFKDKEEDAKYRPYRPVPRGLVSLRELAVVGGTIALVQVLLAALIGPYVVALLAITWVYFGLMSREFFVRTWLKERPLIYLFSHMGIMPLVDWFATGCDWVKADEGMPKGLFWFLLASFFNGVVIEIGRKLRAPEQEERGVQTYTVLWGRAVAVSAWLAAMAATLACGSIAAMRIGFFPAFGTTMGLLWVIGLILGLVFLKTVNGTLAKGLEVYAGVWTLGLYLMLGVVPLVHRLA